MKLLGIECPLFLRALFLDMNERLYSNIRDLANSIDVPDLLQEEVVEVSDQENKALADISILTIVEENIKQSRPGFLNSGAASSAVGKIVDAVMAKVAESNKKFSFSRVARIDAEWQDALQTSYRNAFTYMNCL